QVDFVVLETGLGGRLDSTNVVTPLLSLITNVGRDHEAILGSTIEQIAAEKAGIIKTGVPILTTATGVARDVIVRRAEELGATSYEGNRDFTASRTSYSLDGQTFDWTGWGVTLLDLRVQMLGAHQITNASLAVAACLELRKQGVVISEQALREGLASTRWAGRLEVLSHDPLLLLDGAHNPEGAQVLERALQELLPEQRIVLVIGILGDKAIPEVLAPVIPHATHVIVTRPDLPRAADNDVVARVIREIAPSIPVETTETVREALQLAAWRRAEKADCIVVTGSLYTISEARAIWCHNSKKSKCHIGNIKRNFHFWEFLFLLIKRASRGSYYNINEGAFLVKFFKLSCRIMVKFVEIRKKEQLGRMTYEGARPSWRANELGTC
ncbi:MAG: bifunctional folylpolyglutamate synthase/dihydrofolate synthase, partial [Tumebacillaceae bacterium]